MPVIVTTSEPSPFVPSGRAIDGAELRRAIRAPVVKGLALIAAFLGGFLAWGLMVPISGGVVAAGVISPDGNRRTVQHLEGGIIAALQVRDGDKVVAGQTLLGYEPWLAQQAARQLLACARRAPVLEVAYRQAA